MRFFIKFENGARVWLEASSEKDARKKAKETYNLNSKITKVKKL